MIYSVIPMTLLLLLCSSGLCAPFPNHRLRPLLWSLKFTILTMADPTPTPAPLPAVDPAAVPAIVTYKDDDLVYVDPENKTVVGFLQWSNNGRPKPLAVPDAPIPEGKEARRPRRQRFYPWGTYRSMKKVFKIEGKIRAEPPTLTLDEAIEKALKEPYWNA